MKEATEVTTIDEIKEQPLKHSLVAENYYSLAAGLSAFIKAKGIDEIDFVGCGTSYYLAMGLSKQLNRLSEGKAHSSYYSGSEIMFGLVRLPKKSLLIGLSRSGESSETVGALETARKAGVYTVAVTCEPGSTMTKVADISVEMDFIDEKSIVMTKSFTSMAFMVSTIARELYRPEAVPEYLATIPELSEKTLKNAEALLSEIDPGRYNHFVFLGYEEYFAAGMEGVIKATETSLSDVDCYQTLEYRHGPKSKITGTSLVAILTNDALISEEAKMGAEIEALGGRVMAISSEILKGFETVETGYGKDDFGDWFLRVMPLQLIGVRRAIGKGLDPDRPTHLTKVVKF